MSPKFVPVCPFLPGHCFAFFRHTQLIYAEYVKVAPEESQTGRVKLKISPGTTEEAEFSLGDGKKSTGSGSAASVTEGCVLGLYFS